MRIEILSDAEDDLVAGAKFYERRRAGRFFAGYATKKWPPFGLELAR